MRVSSSLVSGSIPLRASLRQAAIHPLGEAAPLAAPLAAVVYRSRAVQRLSGTELHWLSQIAQSRNRAESITGVIVYDDGVFYQWLEGPPENVWRVMESICKDPRHTDIEILDRHSAAARHFGGWPMQLATEDARSTPWPPGVIETPSDVIADLRRSPSTAPNLLITLGHATMQAWHAAPSETQNPKTGAQALPELHSVIRTIVVPRLLSHHAQAPVHYSPALARQLANLLIGPDSAPATAFLTRLYDHAGSADALLSTIVEPAARALGDLWLDDACTEFDVTIGLTRLQSAMRLMEADLLPHPGFEEPPPAVLVVPEPGERHMLGAALDSDVLWHAGWAPHCEFPASDAALQSMVDDTWFDALDLSLSVAFRREHWLPRVTATIAKVRAASRNPGLVVIVGGRAFTEMTNAAALVGADAGASTAWHVDEVILRELAAAH